MQKTIHIPIKEEEKKIITKASEIRKLKPAVFVRRLALFEAERVLKQTKMEENS